MIYYTARRISNHYSPQALQEFVEKVSVFTQESKEPPGSEVGKKILVQYVIQGMVHGTLCLVVHNII